MHQWLLLESTSCFSENQSKTRGLKNMADSCFRNVFKRKWGTLLYSRELYVAFIETNCARTGLQSPGLKTNLWIDEQIMAKEEVVVEEGVDIHTRTQVLKLLSRLTKTSGGFLLFIVLNSSQKFRHSSPFSPQSAFWLFTSVIQIWVVIVYHCTIKQHEQYNQL